MLRSAIVSVFLVSSSHHLYSLVLIMLSQDDKGKEGQFEASFLIPASTFIAPIKITTANFLNIIQNNKLYTASQELELGRVEMKEVLRVVVCRVLSVEFVEAQFLSATYYGQMVNDMTHVTVLVKAKKPDDRTVLVEIKTAKLSTSQILVQELAAAIKSAQT